MTYEITNNTQYGSIEIYFDGKPAQAIRDALKQLHFRWHGVKKCWYGFAAESVARDAIIAASDTGDIIVTDGYMGASAVYGSKCNGDNKHLYGADLSAAIRADIKRAGLKGVTVSVETYAGGQSITATVRATADDIVTLEEYKAAYRVKPAISWITTDDHPEGIHVNEYFSMDPAQQESTRLAAAEYDYTHNITESRTLNNYRLGEYAEYRDAFRRKLDAVNQIISAYRYDDSNSMVDYFDTNFYYDIRVKMVGK